MTKKREIYGVKMLELGIVVFLGGVYMMPEKIKIFSALYICFMLLFYLLYANGKIRVYQENMLWILYCLLGMCGTAIYGIDKTGNALEFVMSVGIGLLASSVFMSMFVCEKQILSIRIVVLIVLLGCVMQILAPDLLVDINKVTLGKEQFQMFYDFFSWNHIVGFSYQTGVTAHYLCIFELLIIGKYMTLTKHNAKKKVILVVLFGAGLMLVLFTAKRSSILVLFVVLLSMIILFNRKHFAKILMAVTGLGIGGCLVLNYTEAGRRMLARTFGDNPFTGRLRIYKVLWDMVEEHPFMGNGFGSTLEQVTDFTNGHNIYLQTMAETGMIGLAILLIILAGNLVRSIKVIVIRSRMNEISYVEVFCTSYQIYFITVGFIGNILYDVFPLVVYMISSGIIHSMELTLYRNNRKMDGMIKRAEELR